MSTVVAVMSNYTRSAINTILSVIASYGSSDQSSKFRSDSIGELTAAGVI